MRRFILLGLVLAIASVAFTSGGGRAETTVVEDLVAIDKRLDTLIRQVRKYGRKRIMPGSRGRVQRLDDDIRNAIRKHAAADGNRFGEIFPSLLTANLQLEKADSVDTDAERAHHLDSAARSLRSAAQNPMSGAAGTSTALNNLAKDVEDLEAGVRAGTVTPQQLENAILRCELAKLGIMERYPPVLGLAFTDMYQALSGIWRHAKRAKNAGTTKDQLAALGAMRAAKESLERDLRAAGN